MTDSKILDRYECWECRQWFEDQAELILVRIHYHGGYDDHTVCRSCFREKSGMKYRTGSGFELVDWTPKE